jgi:hypothetical protein
MKYVAPAIINVQSAHSALANPKHGSKFETVKGNGSPDSMQINSTSAYEANA